MPFPTDDRAWNDTLLYLLERRRPGERTLAPDEFADELPFVRAYSQPDDGETPSFAWVVVHKGMTAALDGDFLNAVPSWSVPVFANEVFVVFAREPGFAMTDLSDSDHVKSLLNSLSSGAARKPAAEKPATTEPPAEPPPARQAEPAPPPPAEPQPVEVQAIIPQAATLPDAPTLPMTALGHLRQQEVQRLLEEYLGDAAGQRVLDLGCGRGHFAAILIKANILGVDPDEALIATARKLHEGLPNFRFMAAELASLKLTEAPFDITLLVDGVVSGDGATALLESAARHTRAGGLLFLRVENSQALHRRGVGKAGTEGFALAEITSMLRAAGFRPLRADGVVLPWPAGSEDTDLLDALRELGRLAGPAYAHDIVLLARRD
jgi:SAM-dependent methyltransferase